MAAGCPTGQAGQVGAGGGVLLELQTAAGDAVMQPGQRARSQHFGGIESRVGRKLLAQVGFPCCVRTALAPLPAWLGACMPRHGRCPCTCS